ncbi:ACP S-malonyltransferase [Entomospira entomophila]|uniref:Malonyl CoA-acyl carrier protein transacylase n=1 Tax=Entomospira entomophila TaxID=2719988 RepID=A0A968GBX9_9SPIO|nr:ACP S-malonyltransferase [Entomospira entomophilus]NIZ40119.1 ACP S-malonyltransferase [Entomospira entomophilus]WDI35678.1 ACP S-malonyltransferase [Entomospira entomophilus]
MEFKTRIALVFAGQGAQHIGMAKELFDAYPSVRALFELASDVSKKDMRKLLFSSDEATLRETINTQPAVTLASISSLVALRLMGLREENIAWVAGFSLGEYAALVAADVLTIEEIFSLVNERGRIMHQAGEEFKKNMGDPGMAAVIGLNSGQIRAILNDQDEVFIANYNAPEQVVISGLLRQIDRLEPLLKDAGARRVMKLSVSGPFHTPLLSNASLEFKAVVTGLRFASPKIPLYSNVSGGLMTSGAEIQAKMSEQISHPVLWQKIISDATERFSERVAVEIGPGNVLSGLMRANHADYTMFPSMKLDDMKRLVEHITQPTVS